MRTPSNTAIRRLAVARFISVGGSMAAYTALIDLVFRRTHGSTVFLSLTVLLTMGAAGLASPIGGVVADRWDRKCAMIASDLVGAALFVVLAFVGPLWLILTVGFLTAVAATPFRAGSTAAIPNLVQDETLIARANGRLWIGTTLGITLGPAIGGVLVGWAGAGTVFVLNAVSFAASAALVWSIRAPFRGVAEEDAEGGDAEGVLAGFRFLRRDRVQLVLMFAWMVLVLGMGMGIVADRPVAAVFSAGAVGFGVMLGLYGVGAVIGSWLASRLTAATEPAALVTGFVVAGVAGIGIGFAPVFWIVLACNMVWGAGDGVTRVAKTGILQRRTPDAVRGRVSGANESALNLALMAGFLAAGPTIAVLGAKATYAVGGLAALGAAALASTVVAEARRGATGVLRVDPPLAPWGRSAPDPAVAPAIDSPSMTHPEPPVAGDETATLLGSLERQRATLAWKCGGLDAAGLRARTAASTITLGGLLKHLALVEDDYFTRRLHGRELGAPWNTGDWDADPDWEWHSAANDTPDQLMALWQDAVARSRSAVTEALADGDLGQLARFTWPDGRSPSLRRILIDLIEEYARHVGHADIIRESVDGLVGEDPPP